LQYTRVVLVVVNLYASRVLHLFDQDAAAAAAGGGAGSGGGAATTVAAPIKSINCRSNSSKGFEVNSAVGTQRVMMAHAGKGMGTRRQSFAVGAGGGGGGCGHNHAEDDDTDDDDTNNNEGGGGGSGGGVGEESAAMRCFEVALKSSSLLRALNPFASRGPAGEKHDYFVFVANNRRGLEVKKKTIWRWRWE
jgi:hypothetical protein